MTRKLFVATVALVACAWTGQADARPFYISADNADNTDTNGLIPLAAAFMTEDVGDNRPCGFCHVGQDSGGPRNAFGMHILAQDPAWVVPQMSMNWDLLGADDFDQDGFTTAEELMANPRTDPRDANSTPPGPDEDMGGMDDMGGDDDMGAGDEDMGAGDDDMGAGDEDMGNNPPSDMGNNPPADMGTTPPADMGGGATPPADMGGGATPPADPDDDEGSCAVSSPVHPASGGAGLLGLLGLVLGLRRRRR